MDNLWLRHLNKWMSQDGGEWCPPPDHEDDRSREPTSAPTRRHGRAVPAMEEAAAVAGRVAA